MDKDKRKDTAIYVAYDDHEPLDTAFAEKNLLYAILNAALTDVRRPGTDSAKAIQYLLSPDEEYLFSFRSICNLLGLDPKRVLIATGLEERFRRGIGAIESDRPTTTPTVKI